MEWANLPAIQRSAGLGIAGKAANTTAWPSTLRKLWPSLPCQRCKAASTSQSQAHASSSNMYWVVRNIYLVPVKINTTQISDLCSSPAGASVFKSMHVSKNTHTKNHASLVAIVKQRNVRLVFPTSRLSAVFLSTGVAIYAI